MGRLGSGGKGPAPPVPPASRRPGHRLGGRQRRHQRRRRRPQWSKQRRWLHVCFCSTPTCVKATTEGTEALPSPARSTRASPSCTTAIALLLVPRSMPTIALRTTARALEARGAGQGAERHPVAALQAIGTVDHKNRVERINNNNRKQTESIAWERAAAQCGRQWRRRQQVDQGEAG